MKCEERTRLLGVYNQATLAISTSVDDLLHGAALVSPAIYDMRRHAAEKARIAFERAGFAYESHVREHHCELPVKYAEPVTNAIALPRA